MEKNIEQFMEALEASSKYEEGAADLIHKAGTAIKNFFGTSTGAAQRAAQDAQRNAQTQATQQKADEINAQNMSSVDLATKINQVITGALKIANKGLNKVAKNEQVTDESSAENNKQNNNDEQTADGNTEVAEENSQQKTQESLTRLLSALYEADASKNQEYYQTAIKNLQDIQNLVKPFLQGQKEFDKKTLKTISDKINDQSIQGVLAKNDKKALKAIQGINTAINGKIQVLQNSKQQQTQNKNANNVQQNGAEQQTNTQNTTTDQPATDNSQQQNTEQTQNTTTEQPASNNQQTQQSDNQQQNTDTQQNGTEQQTQAQNADAQNKDPAQMQPEEIKQQPEGQQASKEYTELETAITNLTKKFGSNKAIKTLGNAWETFKSMNSKGGADKILQ